MTIFGGAIMNYKVNESKWEELVYLINNFYKPVKYTSGKGDYPDRVTFLRSNDESELFEPSNNIEFYTMNARSNEDSALLIKQMRQIVENKITNPYFMNVALSEGKEGNKKYLKLFEYVQSKLLNSSTTDFKQINQFLVKVFSNLNPRDALKVAEFRESALIYSAEQGYISEDFANQKIKELPNSLIRLSVGLDNQM